MPADPKPRGRKAAKKAVLRIEKAAQALALLLADRDNLWTLSTASARRNVPDWWPTPQDGRSNAAARFERLAGELRELEVVAGAAAAMIPGTPGELPSLRRFALVRDLARTLAKHGHLPSAGSEASESLLVAVLRHAWQRLGIDGDAAYYLESLIERKDLDLPALTLIAQHANQSGTTGQSQGGRSKQNGADPPP
jgi:hypothetical protein